MLELSSVFANFTGGKVEIVRKEIIEPVKRIEVVHIHKHKQTSSKTNNDNDWFFMILCVFIIMYFFVEYQNIISIVLISIILLLEVMLMCIVAFVIKRGWRFKEVIQGLVIYNMIATFAGLLILILMKTPLFYEGYSQIDMMNYFEKYGIIKLIFDDSSMFIYIFSQTIALFFLALFIFRLILSNISLLALIRIIVTGKKQGVWVAIYNRVGGSCRRTNQYMKYSSLLLIISFLFMSGAFVKFVEWVQTIGTTNM